MNLPSILNPLPLAFLAFSFSWTMQVLANNEAFGLVPYFFLLGTIGIVLIKYSMSGKIQFGVRGVKNLDVFVCIFLALSVIHMLLAISLGGYPFAEGARYFLIYVGGGWIYFYTARFATETQIRMALTAIVVATIVISVEWVFETYSRLILLQLVEFQRMAFDYQAIRLGGAENVRQDHISVSEGFRSVGLFDNYTTTGAMVALGAFAALPVLSHATRRHRILALYAFLAVLLIGMATTALVSYLILFPFVAGFINKKWNLWKIFFRIARFLLVVVVAVILTAWLMKETNPLVDFIIRQVSDQFGILTRLDDSQGISWLRMYIDNLGWYSNFVDQKPIAIFFGEGVLNYGTVRYFRGGDVAFLEFASAYGIPFVAVFLIVCAGSLRRLVRSLKRVDLDETKKMYLLFSFAVLAFSLLSLLHYGILFVKSVLAIFYLALGLTRRYAYQRSRKLNLARAIPRDEPGCLIGGEAQA